ncbi:hypothetical protein ACLI09_13805, partial [Flavobacterium sp. RHBU_24]|uniref:hypothetical protein n=1 Tax=Flavobacterium sp. RHBU_24 TaxID=3391185 RepID=UPI003984F2AB
MKKITQLLVLIALSGCLSVSAADKTPHRASANIYAPVNDNCANATNLTVNGANGCTATTTGLTTASFTAATASGIAASSCANPGVTGLDIWYQFTATATYHAVSLWNVLPNGSNAGQEIIMSLYSGGCGALTEVACSKVNYLKAFNLTVGQVYKLRLYYNVANPVLTGSYGICVSTPPLSPGCENVCINGSFEDRVITGNFNASFNHWALQGWRTLATFNEVEYWPTTSGFATAQNGNNFLELCSNGNGEQTIYQEYKTANPTTFTIDFWHRARVAAGGFSTDKCELLVGPPGGPYTVLRQFETNTNAWVHYGDGTADQPFLPGNAISVPDPLLTYTSPANQPVTRIMWRSVQTASNQAGQAVGPSTGNLLDNISIYMTNDIVTPTTIVDCNNPSAYIEAVGYGTWTAHANNPGTVTIDNPGANNITISDFTVPGIYHFDWGRPNCMDTVEIVFQDPTPAAPTVAPVTYCQGQTALPLSGTPDPGNTLVWFYNGGEYVGTGPVPSTATIGVFDYFVVQRNALGCDGIAVAQQVTINSGAAPVTDFTLPATVCEWAGNVTPTLATGFTSGGTFAAAPAGLSINAVTGEIDPAASTPGAYTVTYAIVNNPLNCAVAGSSSDDITIEAAPQLLNATPLTTCDNDYDGLATFNLTTAGTQVANGQTNLTITYHTSQADAENAGGTGIAAPAAFTTTAPGTQTVYIRAVFTGSLSNCYTIKQLVLTVNPKPAAPVVSNYVLCDDPATTGNVATFDLTTKNAEATANVAGLTVTYYTTQAAADSGTVFITNATAYNNTISPQTVWVRVQNSFGCYSTGSFNLIVNPLPVVNSNVAPYQLCDDGTGQATFILSSKNNEVTNNTPGYTVTYYGSQGAANSGLAGALPDSYYTAATTVYARVVNTATGCFATTSVALQPLSSPTLSTVAPLEACATDVSDTAVFNLAPVASQIVGGQPGYTATFYTSQAFADAGGTAGQITSLNNYTSTNATIYVRVVATGVSGNCYSVGPVDLLVNPHPVIPTLSDYVVCDDTAPAQDGVETFDLTSKNAEATSDPTDTVTYYTDNGDAQLGQNAITNPSSFQNTEDEQTIWVRVETVNGCSDTGSFKLIVNPLPLADLGSPVFYACEETPGQGLFDLDEIDPVITGGQP